MATDETESIEESFENMITSVRESFARLYAALKARELRTLRQLQAVRRQCETSHAHAAACLRSAHVSYDNEATILADIAHFGELHLDRLNLDGDTFLVEDYVCPDEDHMYSYKCIDELVAQNPSHLDLDIEQAALRQITSTGDCVCSVHLTPDEVSKQFREDVSKPKAREASPERISDSPQVSQSPGNDDTLNTDLKTEVICANTDETAKINPTEEWLNCIKNQIETEPTQVTDVMEHSTIVC